MRPIFEEINAMHKRIYLKPTWNTAKVFYKSRA